MATKSTTTKSKKTPSSRTSSQQKKVATQKAAGKKASSQRKKSVKATTTTTVKAKKPVKKAATVKVSTAVTRKQPKPLPVKPSRIQKLLGGPEVMLNLHNEHKYMSKLLDLFAEELQQFNLHSLPDYNIMYEVVHYLHNVTDHSHHPREDIILKKLSDIDEDFRQECEALIIRHEGLEKKSAALLDSLKILTKDKKSEAVENFQFRCEDYLKAQRSHMDIEESKVFPRVMERFTEDDWLEILPDIQPKHDPVFGEKVERRYRQLYDYLTDRMERAAEEFTLAEFIGLSAFTETIGTMATSFSDIVSVFRVHSRKTIKNDILAYRRLWRSRSRKPQDYVSVTVDCMLNSFDAWSDCMREIGTILRQTRSQVAEPYNSRIRLYHDLHHSDSIPEETDNSKTP